MKTCPVDSLLDVAEDNFGKVVPSRGHVETIEESTKNLGMTESCFTRIPSQDDIELLGLAVAIDGGHGLIEHVGFMVVIVGHVEVVVEVVEVENPRGVSLRLYETLLKVISPIEERDVVDPEVEGNNAQQD